MRTHIFIPQDGTRMLNQTHRSAIESVQAMSGMEGDDIVFIINAKVSKRDALDALAQLKEYIEKDLS